MVVVDASAALAWCFEDEHDDAADALLDEVVADGALVPPLWFEEIANALLVAERRARLSAARAAQLVSVLESLPLEITEDDPSLGSLVQVGREHGLTAYDATYLVTALQSGCPLATRDAALAAAARRAGVVVFGDGGLSDK